MDTSFAMFRETEVPENDVIISRTDLNGIITYANDIFAKISGYSADELIGQPHSILRHPDMPKSVFKEMWETIRKEEVWEGHVKNLRKDGGYYWVHARVSGVYKDGELVEYKSLRSYVSCIKRNWAQELYDAMREEEEGESVRVVTYLPNQLYHALLEEAEQSGKSTDELLQERLAPQR